MPASRNLASGLYVLVTTLLASGLLLAICLLHDDRELQFTTLRDDPVVRPGLIYDRIHSDPAAADVVFIGTAFGVDAARTASIEIKTLPQCS